jgi:hypothetical protein
MDEAIVALDLEEELREAGFSTVCPITTCAGAEAWLAGHAPPRAAVVSYQLADGDCAAVLEHLTGGHIPVLLFTALPVSFLPPRFRNIPRLTKPVAAQAVSKALASLLASSSALSADQPV